MAMNANTTVELEALQKIEPKRKKKRQAKAAAKPLLVPKVVGQDRLRKFYELQAEYEEARRRFVAIHDRFTREQEILSRAVEEGAPIREGLYTPDSKRRLIRRPHYKQALIDAKGKEYQEQILNATSPRAYFRFRVS